MTSISAFVNAQNASGRGASGMALEYDASASAAPAGGNSVIGFQSASFASGYNAMVLDGPRSQYAVQVDGVGNVSVTDTTTHQTVTDQGLSYILFNGSTGAPGSTATAAGGSDILYIGGSGSTTVAEMYSLFQRQPDLPGLEAWGGALKAGTTLQSIAQGFVASSEFAAQNPAAAGPSDHGGANDQAFVTVLYQNILGRAPDAAGLQAWTADLAAGDSRGNVLIDFATSTENANHTSAWLVNTSAGGYADPGALLPAQTVLTQAVGQQVLNAGLIDPTTAASTVSNGTVAVLQDGQHLFIDSINQTPGQIIELSAIANEAHLSTLGTTIATGPAGNATIVFGDPVNGGQVANNTVLMSGSANAVSFGNATNTVIVGYVAGSDSIGVATIDAMHPDATSQGHVAVSLLAPTAASPVDGASLTFTQNAYVLNVGSVGDGSAAAVAAAANAVYKVADVNGNGNAATPAGMAGESLTVIGTTGSGSTVVYQWGAGDAAHGGVAVASADTNANHLIDAAELHLSATLVGVHANALTAADFA